MCILENVFKECIVQCRKINGTYHLAYLAYKMHFSVWLGLYIFNYMYNKNTRAYFHQKSVFYLIGLEWHETWHRNGFQKDEKKITQKHLHQKVIFIGKSSDLKHSEWKNTPFLQPFTYMKINLNIIYMATDYSMYKARTSKLKLTGALFFIFFGEKLQLHVNSPKNERGDLAEIQILTVPGSCPLTKIGRLQNTVVDKSIQLQQLFFSMFFCFYKFKMYFKKGTPKLHKIASSETPGVTTPYQHRYSHMTGYINVGYSIFRQSRANLCTCINRHSSFRQTGGPSLYKASNQMKTMRERGVVWVNGQGSKPGGYSTRHHPTNCTEA